ncbi:MAG: tRNA cyclic N6-threonylcarbamoyladenosine(37) synthase TcdA [Propionivibrio sp.]|uniref:tRNA cyclic N6-threonylcarbamoyladenosine(37) synthase TcdA n=1 Tax=Propionivibrio sp. TaxID=2212460 RepID=UPI001A4ECB6A|nr:tRNA cyclic N6-threonylcarbamoyladenosine(37) synthase TcdA [Propionivibrio sp.]MBL8413831.1 tRNA cyclic N6-threonylcarbamoyladenosine(37) synthase TcdA [Propionivibrio sp.]
MIETSGDHLADPARRFGGIQRLYGADALARFQAAHVCVVGIGGVGSWAVEALARSAIGQLTLIDLDMVAESNVNRQIQALGDAFGKAKTDAMAERILAINPACQVSRIEDFVSPDNLVPLLDKGFDYVIDAIDQVRTKAAMIAWCKARELPLITAGSAGGQIDPTRIEITDLARTVQDPLLSKVRSLLRKEYGFTREPKKKFGVPAVFSGEALRYPENDTACDEAPVLTGLNCAGFGSSVCVTATFGLFAASAVLKYLAIERNVA